MNTWEEYEGEFGGTHLSGLRFAFILTGTAPAAVTLAWLMVADHAGVIRMLSWEPSFDPAWPGLLMPEAAAATPQLGLFFSAADSHVSCAKDGIGATTKGG